MLTIDVRAYHGLPSQLKAEVDRWLQRNRDQLSAMGVADNAKGWPAIDLIEWSGEGYRVRGFPTGYPRAGDDLARDWWVPPEPPPIELLKHAAGYAALEDDG